MDGKKHLCLCPNGFRDSFLSVCWKKKLFCWREKFVFWAVLSIYCLVRR